MSVCLPGPAIPLRGMKVHFGGTEETWLVKIYADIS